jgi:hypothetical protein
VIQGRVHSLRRLPLRPKNPRKGKGHGPAVFVRDGVFCPSALPDPDPVVKGVIVSPARWGIGNHLRVRCLTVLLDLCGDVKGSDPAQERGIADLLIEPFFKHLSSRPHLFTRDEVEGKEMAVGGNLEKTVSSAQPRGHKIIHVLPPMQARLVHNWRLEGLLVCCSCGPPFYSKGRLPCRSVNAHGEVSACVA